MSRPPTSVTLGSPVGRIVVTGDEEAVTGIAFATRLAERGLPVPGPIEGAGAAGPVGDAARQLHAYFAGELRAFDLPLRPEGTPFQHAVWSAVAAIPYGDTATYGEVAMGLGRPRAARAVGAANGANPLAIVVPCHRLLGSDRSLTGYGGGLAAKRFLLALEGTRTRTT